MGRLRKDHQLYDTPSAADPQGAPCRGRSLYAGEEAGDASGRQEGSNSAGSGIGEMTGAAGGIDWPTIASRCRPFDVLSCASGQNCKTERHDSPPPARWMGAL